MFRIAEIGDLNQLPGTGRPDMIECARLLA
jgi:hypothetical protein